MQMLLAIYLPAGSDLQFDGGKMDEDVDSVCTIHMISHQIIQDDPRLLIKETRKRSSPHSSHTVCEERVAKPMFR